MWCVGSDICTVLFRALTMRNTTIRIRGCGKHCRRLHPLVDEPHFLRQCFGSRASLGIDFEALSDQIYNRAYGFAVLRKVLVPSNLLHPAGDILVENYSCLLFNPVAISRYVGVIAIEWVVPFPCRAYLVCYVSCPNL